MLLEAKGRALYDVPEQGDSCDLVVATGTPVDFGATGVPSIVTVARTAQAATTCRCSHRVQKSPVSPVSCAIPGFTAQRRLGFCFVAVEAAFAVGVGRVNFWSKAASSAR